MHPSERSNRRLFLVVGGVLAAIALAWGVRATTAGLPHQDSAIADMGVVTGTVVADQPFTAARVYLRNVDSRILYQVFTHEGRFRAVALFPGNYEVFVTTQGLGNADDFVLTSPDEFAPTARFVNTLESESRNLFLNAGDHITLDEIRLHPTNPTIRRVVNWSAQILDASNPSAARAAQSYDDIYPPGPGLDVLERTCMVCHGENWVSAQPGSRDSWEARVNRMMGVALSERSAATYAEGLLTHRNQAMRFSLEDKEDLMEYLVTNFGPDAEPRFVPIDYDIPLDESKLSKAMFIEYYLPLDPPGEMGNAPEFNSNRRGQDPRFDADGNVWLIDRNYPHRIVRLDPRTGEWTGDYVFPDPLNGNHEVIIDPAGILWMPEHGGRQRTTEKRLLGFNPKTEKFEYVIPMDPDNVVRNETKFLQSLAMDSWGNIYVGWIMGGALSKYDRRTGQVSVFPMPTINAIPYGVVADSKDNIFIADWGSGNVWKFDTGTNGYTTYTSPTYPSHVRRLNVDYDDNVWWGAYTAGKRMGFLAKLDQRTGKITEFPIPRRNSQVYDVMAAPDNTIWGPDYGGGFAALLHFDPSTEIFSVYPTPQNADMPKVQVARDGAVWYSPRSSGDWPGLGVLHLDMDKIATLGAYYVNGPPGYPFKPGLNMAAQ